MSIVKTCTYPVTRTEPTDIVLIDCRAIAGKVFDKIIYRWDLVGMYSLGGVIELMQRGLSG